MLNGLGHTCAYALVSHHDVNRRRLRRQRFAARDARRTTSSSFASIPTASRPPLVRRVLVEPQTLATDPRLRRESTSTLRPPAAGSLFSSLYRMHSRTTSVMDLASDFMLGCINPSARFQRRKLLARIRLILTNSEKNQFHNGNFDPC